MTLLERTTTHTPNLDERLAQAMRTLHGALGIALTSSSAGERALLVIDRQGDAFLDVEEDAMERLLEVRRAYPEINIELLCLTVDDASTMDLRADARVYDF